MENRNQLSIIGYTISGVWVLSVLTAVVSGNIDPLKFVTPIMLIYVGFLFGDKIVFVKKVPPSD